MGQKTYDECKTEDRPRKCNATLTCEELRTRKIRNQLCVEARKQVVRECFGNMPDAGHEEAIEQVYNALATCQSLIDAPGGACAL